MELEVDKYFSKIEKLGGVIPAIEAGYFQREIALSASEYQQKVDSNEQVIVGVNDFIKENKNIEIPILEIRKEVYKEQISNLKNIKSIRDNRKVKESLNNITKACSENVNLMPLIIKAAKSYATLGEIVNAMKIVFGDWTENVSI